MRHSQQSILALDVHFPLISKQAIKRLYRERNWDLLTSTYYDEKASKWQPMLSIWEIETLPALERYFEEGGRSTQNFLNQYGNQRVSIHNLEEFKKKS